MIRPWVALWKKEMGGYFFSPAAYVVMMFFLIVMGYSLWVLADMLANSEDFLRPGHLVFGENLLFWLSLMVVVPILTMRLVAGECRSGTFETLMTAPVTPAVVITAKYAAVLVFYTVLWLPTLLQAALLKAFDPFLALDLRLLFSGYAGALLTGAFALALGLLCSAAVRTPLVAAMAAFSAVCVWFALGFLPYLAHGETLRAFGESVSVIRHMLDFSGGILDSRALVLYVSGTAFLLFAAVRVLEARS